CTDERFRAVTEATAYAVAVEGLEGAGEHGIAVRAARLGDRVVVDAEGSSVAPTIYLADRVGALGGTVAATLLGLQAEIPCACSSSRSESVRSTQPACSRSTWSGSATCSRSASSTSRFSWTH